VREQDPHNRFTMADSMSGDFAASSRPKPRPFPAIIVGGLIVGVLDLTYAILVYSPKEPILIPQTIAVASSARDRTAVALKLPHWESSCTSLSSLVPQPYTFSLAASWRS
jgi:hypothetical protein